MSKISKHKQNKRKARQRNVKAAKIRTRLREARETKLAGLLDTNFENMPDMTDEMKSASKTGMWKVFSTLPAQLQEDALKDFQKGSNGVTEFDFEGISNLFGETLNRYMHPHALVEILDWLENNITICLPDEIRPLIKKLDAQVISFITKSSMILQRFEEIKLIEDKEERSTALYSDDVIGEYLVPTLLAYQEDHEALIEPILEVAEQHTDLIDNLVVEYAKEQGIETIEGATRAIHLKRVERHFDLEAAKNATY
ncbi:hypothetical protein [Vibrio phage pTD1]|uniref:Uncharacterized protein n=1 Tax=Vibrio phage pTD1 TaxID=1938577 RepID=A0A1Q2U2X1_9CAUD|nr:hypothetical protein FDH33_gp107 [Vibrio phage pTD1]BAW98316.1 hypothetical protein [Vibrio phage pTD1]